MNQGAPNPYYGGDPWQQYQQQMNAYNQNMAQYQQQVLEKKSDSKFMVKW